MIEIKRRFKGITAIVLCFVLVLSTIGQGLVFSQEAVAETKADEEQVDISTPSDAASTETVDEDGVLLDGAIYDDATLSDAEIASMADAIMPLDAGTNCHFIKLELHKGKADGELVADLLDSPSAATLNVEQEYYLVVQVQKDDSADDCWVAIDIPYWMDTINMIGTDPTTPKDADDTFHTTLDRLISYDPATGGSNAHKCANPGKYVYHIKSSVDIAGFQISMKPSTSYYNMDTLQEVTTEKLVASCGDMNGTDAGTETDSIETTITKKGGGHCGWWSTGGTRYGAVDEKLTDCGADLCGNSIYNFVASHIEYDIVYPKDAILEHINFERGTDIEVGTPVLEGDNYRVHVKRDKPAGFGACRMYWYDITFPSQYDNTTQQVTIENFKLYIYGDEHHAVTAPVTATQYYIISNGAEIKAYPSNFASYDWLGQTGLAEGVMITQQRIAAIGSKEASSAPQTIEATYPDNAIIRTITIPKYTGASDKVTVNGVEYNLASIATLYNDDNVAVIRNTDIGLGPDDSITSVKYDCGALSGGDQTFRPYDGGWYAGYTQSPFAAYGSFKDGSAVKTDFKIYTTGTDPDLATAKAVATGSPATEGTFPVVFSGTAKDKDNKTSIVAGGSVHYNGTLTPGPNFVRNTLYLYEPSIYLTLPEGIDYANFTLDGESVEGTDVTTDEARADGMKLIRIDLPANTEFGYYKADGTTPKNSHNIQFDILTDKAAAATTVKLSDIISIGDGKYKVATGDNPDTYGINNGYNMKGSDGQFTIQELKAVTVDNSMRVSGDDGVTWSEWLKYNEGDPNGTRAFINNNAIGEYKVDIKNQTGEEVKDLQVFIPVAEPGQNYGLSFNPDGDQEFDLTFEALDVPEGYTVVYLKMHDGVSYDVNKAPDYTVDADVVTDPSEANMIMIKAPGVIASDAEAVTVTFKVYSGTGPQFSSSEEDLGKINHWNTVPKYVVGSTTMIPAGYPEAIEIAGGAISGTVYNDTNGNGVMDSSEKGIAGVKVTASDNFALANRTLTTVTDADGNYSFSLLRNKNENSIWNKNTVITITVYNPDGTIYREFSPVTTTGNKPSVVTPETDQLTAVKDNIACESRETVEIDAGLIGDCVIDYIAGPNGSMDPTSETLLAGKNPQNVPLATDMNADEGYKITESWKADHDVTLNDGTVIKAGDIISKDQVHDIKAVGHITLAAVFEKIEPETTPEETTAEETTPAETTPAETTKPSNNNHSSGSDSTGGHAANTTPSTAPLHITGGSSGTNIASLYGLNPDGSPRGNMDLGRGLPKTGEEWLQLVKNLSIFMAILVLLFSGYLYIRKRF